MIAHEVLVNGQRVCIAGVESGVFSTDINLGCGGGRTEYCNVSIGGLDNTSDEHLNWPGPAIRVGDEVTVRVVRVDVVDPPTCRKPTKREQHLTHIRIALQSVAKNLTPKQRRVLLRGLIRELRQLEDEAAEG